MVEFSSLEDATTEGDLAGFAIKVMGSTFCSYTIVDSGFERYLWVVKGVKEKPSMILDFFILLQLLFPLLMRVVLETLRELRKSFRQFEKLLILRSRNPRRKRLDKRL